MTIAIAGHREELPELLATASELCRRSAVSIHALVAVSREPSDLDIDDLARQLRAADLGNARLSAHVRSGDLSHHALGLAAEIEADLVLVWGGSQAALHRARQVVRAAACSVLVVEPNREALESQGLIPTWPRCPNCARTRALSGGARWFCAVHVDSSRRRYARVASQGGPELERTELEKETSQ